MKKFAIMIIAVLAFAGASLAEVNPLWMCGGKTAMKSWAVSQISRANVGIGSVTGLGTTNGESYVWLKNSGEKPLDILNDIRATKVVTDVVDPEKDEVFIHVGLADAEYNQLFWGSTWGKMVKNDLGKWVLPTNFCNLSLQMNYYVPIRIDGLSSASLILRGDNGNYMGQIWLEVRDGVMWFPTDRLDCPGDIVASIYDEETGNYRRWISSLRGCDETKTTEASGSVNASLEGVNPYTNSNVHLVLQEDDNGKGESPLVVESITENGIYSFSARTSGGQIPKGIWLRCDWFGPDEIYYFPGDDDGKVSLHLAPGEYHVIYDWETFDDRDAFPIYYYGGGKG